MSLGEVESSDLSDDSEENVSVSSLDDECSLVLILKDLSTFFESNASKILKCPDGISRDLNAHMDGSELVINRRFIIVAISSLDIMPSITAVTPDIGMCSDVSVFQCSRP